MLGTTRLRGDGAVWDGGPMDKAVDQGNKRQQLKN
jgi:hypothetical protein